jgi:hypothetical protein
MRRKFSWITFVRMVPHPLLSAILKKLNVKIKVPTGRKSSDLETCAKSIEKLAKRDLDRVEDAFRAIDDLAESGGHEVLIEADLAVGEGDLAKHIPSDACGHHWAAWAWLHRKKVFAKALSLLQISQVPSWRSREDLPKQEPNLSKEALKLLGKEFSALLVNAQARGRRCTVESLSWGERDYLYVHPDDFVRPYLAHDGSGRLNRKIHRPTFDVAMAFNRSAGKLETGGKLPPKLKDKLDVAFAKTCLNYSLGPYPTGKTVQLDHLLNPSFSFVTEPADDLVVIIRKVCLQFPDTARQIDLTNDPKRDNDMSFLFDCLNDKVVVLDAMRVISARVQFFFAQRGDIDECTRTIQLTRKSCNLRDIPEWQGELIEKCLRASGLVN